MTTLASLIRERRKELGLTQEDVAKRANVRLKMVNRIENGHTRRPNRLSLAALAGALEIPIERLEGFRHGNPPKG